MSVLSTSAADAFPDPAASSTADSTTSFSSVTFDAWTAREAPAPSVAAADSLQDELFSLINAAAASGQGGAAERARSVA